MKSERRLFYPSLGPDRSPPPPQELMQEPVSDVKSYERNPVSLVHMLDMDGHEQWREAFAHTFQTLHRSRADERRIGDELDKLSHKLLGILTAPDRLLSTRIRHSKANYAP